MTVALLVVAFLGVWNLFRFHPALPSGDRTTAARVATTALGVALAIVAVGVVAEFADDLLDWLEISAATARIAVGAVVALVGLRDLLTAPPEREPALAGLGAALVPLFFPLLFSPAAGLLALSGAADHDLATVLIVATMAGTPLVVAAAVDHDGETASVRRVERGLHRFVAGMLVLAAFALLIDGIFDI